MPKPMFTLLSKNPLLWFLIIGAALFTLELRFTGRPSESSHAIRVSQAVVVQLTERLRKQLNREPSFAEVDGAISEYVDDEILFREGLKLGLHLSDEVVRRRLAQIMGFVLEGSADLVLPSDDELRRYFTDHINDYSQPERLSGQHIFFNRDRYATGTHLVAEQALQAIRRGEKMTGVGDPFLEGSRFTARSMIELFRSFGSEYAALAETAPLGAWLGPVNSAFGVHIVRIDMRIKAKVAEFEVVRGRVLIDYLAKRRKSEQRAALNRLRKNYTVQVK